MSNDSKKPTMSRRAFTIGLGGSAVLLGVGGVGKLLPENPVCRPPGGQDEDSFISLCLRCEICREVCPTGVIAPAHIEDGILNARTPTMNFKLGWCDYCQEDHNGEPLCVQKCPTEALKLPEDATPENVIIGKAVINRDWCLAWQAQGCRVCIDKCPYDAIDEDEYERPIIVPENCNGCGLCELVCISMSSGSIANGATDRAITIEHKDLTDYPQEA